jgi:hypothetical protein
MASTYQYTDAQERSDYAVATASATSHKVEDENLTVGGKVLVVHTLDGKGEAVRSGKARRRGRFIILGAQHRPCSAIYVVKSS